jgi:DUF4097 and DUF4098 domain-containing protein YvlB
MAVAASGCVVRSPSFSYTITSSPRESSSREQTADLRIEAGDTLVIDGPNGDLSVRVSRDVAPHLAARITGLGDTTAIADRERDAHRVVTERSGRTVFVRVVREPADSDTQGAAGVRVAVSAIVPDGVALDLRTSTGDLTAAGPFRDCTLDATYGDVDLSDADGTVKTSSGTGEIRLARVTGSRVEARTSYGQVELRGVRANAVAAHAGVGRVAVVDCSGSLELTSGYGDVTVERSTGSLTASSGSGDVVVRDFAGASGEPTKVALESSYGDVEVGGILDSVVASSASGDVAVTARPGSRVGGEWRLRSGYGQVEVRVPADFACAVDARTGYGSIDCEFPMRIEPGTASRNALRGTIGPSDEPAGTLSLESSSGRVVIRRLP